MLLKVTKNPLLLLLLSLLITSILFAQPRLDCIQKSSFPSNWKYLGPFNTDNANYHQKFGAITAISVNPLDSNEIYIGTMTSGLFHTMNRGQDWVCLTDNYIHPVIGVSDIHVNYKVSPHHILIATGSHNYWYDVPNFGTLYTNDNGLSWNMSRIEGQEAFFTCEIRRVIHGRNASFAIGMKEIYRSTDDCKKWSLLFSTKLFPQAIPTQDFEILSMELNPEENKLFFTTYSSPLLDENKATLTRECEFWMFDLDEKNIVPKRLTKLTHLLKNVHDNGLKNPSFALKLTKGPDAWLYLDRTFSASLEHAIYKFNTGTLTIDDVKLPNEKNLPEDIYWRKGLKVNPLNPKIQYLFGNLVYKSLDSGKHFNALYGYSYGENNIPHADIRAAYFTKFSTDGLSDEIYIGTDGGLSYSADGGLHFRNLSGNKLPITQFYGLGSSPFSGIVSAGAQDNSIMSYLPQTNEWIYSVMGDGYDVEYSKRIPGEAFGQYNVRSMMRTLNDKVPFYHSGFLPPKEAAINKKTLATHKNGSTYFAEEQLHILKHGSQTWFSYPLPQPHKTLAMAVSESDSSIVYVSNLWSDLLKSIDGGKTFTNISSNLTVNGKNYNTRIHAICISPTDPEKVWISIGYFGDYLDPCKATERVLYSPNGGKDWVSYSEGLPVYYVSDLVYLDGSEDALFASTFEGVYFKSSLTEPWRLFSDGLPKAIISELNINYCRGKLTAATYGRGLWETDLPKIKGNALSLKGNHTWSTESEAEALYFTTDIELKKKASLYIDCQVHMAKDKSLFVHKANQITYGPNGRIVNECGEKWGGIKIRK